MLALSLQAAEPDFVKDVQPILAAKCIACHGPGQQMAGLRLDGGASILKGAHSGAVVAPGDSGKSRLVERVASVKPGFKMPPAGEPLTPSEVAIVRAWIDAGAKAPQGGHWSFQAIRRPTPPAVQNAAWVRNPIDAFVLARLDAEKVQPSSEASKTTLLRRASLDLIGLPPTPSEINEFLNDPRPDAYERVLDRLFASPHYGEKWARHWLDLAHYADSDGFEKDLVRPWAWRYRHWLINALNQDLPFDRFTAQQIAGDLLPNPTVEQRVATGFHRTVLTNREAGVDRAEARFDQDISRTNTVSTVWLGLTTGCAQCHNHKYDPVSQKEYYQLFAYVSGIQEDDIDAPLPGEVGPYLKARPEYELKRAALLAEYDIAPQQAAWESKLKNAVLKPGTDIEWDFMVTSFRAMNDNATKMLFTDPAQRSRRQRERMTAAFLGNPGPDIKKDKEHEAKLKEAREKLSKLNEMLPVFTEAMAVRTDPEAAKPYIALGGDYRSKGSEVQPGLPAVLTQAAPRNRLELAQWLTGPENPLTARVTANRMWQEFFGRGIVRTSDDFGMQGEKPTHPELLDWLASEFRDSGWSMKRMHRWIVSSATYRQSSHARPDLKERDPGNLLLARQGRLRLPAELVRDAALSASGLLNTSIGGRSIRPPLPAGIAELGYANNVKWAESTGPDRYRRGLYVHFQRTTPYPQLMNFDAPDSNVACVRRSRSNTPLQALNLLNDPVFVEAAQGFAVRLLNEATTDRVSYAFRLALGRDPSARERERMSKYVDEQQTGQPEAAAWVAAGRVLMNLDEFIVRE